MNMRELAPFCQSIVGIDFSKENVKFGEEYLEEIQNARLIVMDAHHLQFEESFDVVLCLQNGLSSMRLETKYIEEMMKLLSTGGRALISSYSPNF